MPLPLTGPLSMTQIANEAGVSIAAAASLNNQKIRNIARIFDLNTRIAYSDLLGKSRFTFENGDFSTGTLVDNTTTYSIPGWTVYRSQTRLNGVNNILGYPTPNDTALPSPTPGDNLTVSGMSYTAQLTTDLPPGSSSPVRSMRLISQNGATTGYGIIHGPYVVTNSAVNLESGDTVKFWWKAQGGGDAYDIYAYLLNIDTGATLELVNATGSSASATTSWVQVTRTIDISQIGNYHFVFISGSYDFTGGTILGASLYITNIEVTKWFENL